LFHYSRLSGFLFLLFVSLIDFPLLYILKKAAYRSVSPLHKTRFGGFLLLQGGRMNDCPRRYVQKKAAYRSVSSLHKPRQCKLAGFCFYRATG
ncbi:hypothetical protein, partial [Salmonella enterica]|uniref:hypothetical protein n=1 Tax=Salmonella enterica TaxID=28901 RepID=UPI001CB796E1